MQQRVGIARALAIRPEILPMDEPFGSPDVQTRDLLQDELLRTSEQEQKTVTFVTHSIERAIYLADRIVDFTLRVGTTRRHRAPVPGIQTLAALLILREKIIKAVLAGADKPQPGRPPNRIHLLDAHYENLQRYLRRTFDTLGLAA